MTDSKFLKVAKEATLEAGRVISKYSGQVGKLIFKNDDTSDFATKADVEAEKIIVKILSSHFPAHNILAEEESEFKKGSEYTWAIDPIDGTISYVAGIPNFTVSIGLLENDQPILGVIYHIAAEDLYYAEKNNGAFLNGKKITVNRKDELAKSVASFDFGHKKSRQEKFNTYISPLLNKVGYVYSLGSGALELAYTAAGILEVLIQTGGVWDVLAGTVIIREAGGKVTDLEGNEPNWSKEQITVVASNGLIHDQILEALKR